MRFLGIDSTCRASFYFYNTKEDVEYLISSLQEIVSNLREMSQEYKNLKREL